MPAFEMPGGRRWLYLPIEIPERELEAKVLLALEAVGRGYRVILGSKAMISMMHRFPKGVLLYKDSSQPMLPVFKRLRRQGHAIVVHDEEGLVQISDEEYSKKRLEFETMREIDLFLCWGSHQAKTVRCAAARMTASPAIVVTGHPRVDLLRPEMDRRLTSTGSVRPMVLINTKLAECNHRNGPRGWIDILKAHGMIRTEEDLSFREKQIKYKAQLFDAYVDMIARLCHRFPDIDFVVRPHPTENLKRWLETLGSRRNLTVTFSDPVSHWIRRASMIIHTGCTTAVEARLLGVPAVQFEPLDGGEFDVPLPRSVSRLAANVEELEALISEVHAGASTAHPNWAARFPAELTDHISQFSGEPSYIAVMNAISQLPVEKSRMKFGQALIIKTMALISRTKDRVRKPKVTRLSSVSRSSIEQVAISLSEISHPGIKFSVKELYPGLFLLQIN